MKRSARRADYKQRFEEAIGLRDSGRLPEAEHLLRALMEEGSRYAEAALILGGILLEQERFADSTELFTLLAKRQPASEKASLGLFHSLWGSSRYDEAYLEMRRYLADHDSWEYRLLRRDLEAEEIT